MRTVCSKIKINISDPRFKSTTFRLAHCHKKNSNKRLQRNYVIKNL